MTDSRLKGKRIAILATDGFEQSELFKPKEALEAAGAKVDVVSLKDGKIKGWNGGDWGKTIKVDVEVANAKSENYDGIVLPGGVINPDKLRIETTAVSFVEEFIDAQKPIAAICHGPQLLIETEFLRGRTLTSWSSLKTDLINAGAKWVDQEVVVDGQFVTSRKPDDIPAFNENIIKLFSGAFKGVGSFQNVNEGRRFSVDGTEETHPIH